MKEWFIFIDDVQEGPFSFFDLRMDLRLTPDTFVWKEGMENWKPIREVKELEELFKDKPEGKPLHDDEKKAPIIKGSEETEALLLQNNPSQFYFWLFVLLLLLAYVLYQLTNN